MIINFVREYERLVRFHLGRFDGVRGPGIVWLVPIVHTAVRVSLREQFLEIPRQVAITRDNAPIGIDFLIYFRIVNPDESVLKVADPVGAVQGIATTTLRAVIGDITLDDVLAKRDQINQVLQVKLDEVTSRWGIKVNAVEIREIEPPRDIQDAMNRQMAAERYRRATVIEADGKRQATVTVAEGDKQAAILTAEGSRQANILRAEGERQAAILEAEGFATALHTINETARLLDEKTLNLQYLETLKAMGSSPATKFIFPLEFTSIAQSLAKARLQGDGASQP